MSTNLKRRIDALEAVRSPGPVIGFWAMTENCEPMTDEENEKGVAALKANRNSALRILHPRGLIGANLYHQECLVRARSGTLSPPIEIFLAKCRAKGIPWMHDHRLIFNRPVADDS